MPSADWAGQVKTLGQEVKCDARALHTTQEEGNAMPTKTVSVALQLHTDQELQRAKPMLAQEGHGKAKK